jgi:hypothetical protein
VKSNFEKLKKPRKLKYELGDLFYCKFSLNAGNKGLKYYVCS